MSQHSTGSQTGMASDTFASQHTILGQMASLSGNIKPSATHSSKCARATHLGGRQSRPSSSGPTAPPCTSPPAIHHSTWHTASSPSYHSTWRSQHSSYISKNQHFLFHLIQSYYILFLL